MNALAATAVAILLLPFPAQAQTRLIPIVFEKISGHRVGGDLVIEYRIDGQSWRMMQSDRIEPKLHVSLENADRGPPSKVAYDRDLTAKEGTINLSVPSSISKLRCEISASGGHRGAHIAWMDLGGAEVERAGLRVTDGAPPPPVVGTPPPAPPAATNWAAEPRIIEMCGAAFDGTANEKACLQVVKSSPRDPTAIIGACEALMDGDDNELECVRIAIRISFDPMQALTACEASFDGDANELECVRLVTRFSKDPTATIAACDSARSGDPDELDCLKDASSD